MSAGAHVVSFKTKNIYFQKTARASAMPRQACQSAICIGCTRHQPRAAFSTRQLKANHPALRVCQECASPSRQRNGQIMISAEASRTVCGVCLPWDCFAMDRQHRRDPVCRDYTKQKADEIALIRLGECNRVCPPCHAHLWSCESPTYCCNNGKCAVDFVTYLQSPSSKLKDVLARTGPWRQECT